MSARGFDPGASGRDPDDSMTPDAGATRPCGAWIVWERWVTAMDDRTCPRCAGLNGKTFRDDEGPRPPLHNGCRCSRVVFDRECAARPGESGRGGSSGRLLP